MYISAKSRCVRYARVLGVTSRARARAHISACVCFTENKEKRQQRKEQNMMMCAEKNAVASAESVNSVVIQANLVNSTAFMLKYRVYRVYGMETSTMYIVLTT